jgi:hypothetical protein
MTAIWVGDLTLAEILTEIEVTRADVLRGDEYCAYCGMSKQLFATAQAVRGEPGRFLWEATEKKGSSNIPIVKWCSSWYYGRMALNRGDLDWHGFETRIVYQSLSKFNAGLVEKASKVRVRSS